MGWILRMVAGSGRSRLLLQAGDLSEAEAQATQLVELAESAGERTAAAVSRRTLAEIAFQQSDMDTAQREIDRALGHLDGEPTPLAAWRVHLVAAEIFRLSDRPRASRHQSEARHIAESLAGSLQDGDPLRATLLTDADLEPTIEA